MHVVQHTKRQEVDMANVIEEIRESVKASQREMAKALGVTYSRYREIERSGEIGTPDDCIVAQVKNAAQIIHNAMGRALQKAA